jgi:hypothetical protein
MVSKAAQPTEQPATFAEGPPIPTTVPPLSPEAVAATQKAPTPADYKREHGTYRAVYDLNVGTVRAVLAGGAVPASHPLLRDSEDGPGWVSQGSVVLTGDYEAPEDLAAAHEAYAAEQARLQAERQATYPGAHPGA